MGLLFHPGDPQLNDFFHDCTLPLRIFLHHLAETFPVDNDDFSFGNCPGGEGPGKTSQQGHPATKRAAVEMLQADFGLLVNGDDGDAAFDNQKGAIGRIALFDDALAGGIDPMFHQIGKEFDDLGWCAGEGLQLA